MILGNVRNREAFLELEVHGNEKHLHRGEVLIDTGFNGYLTLPARLVPDLNLTFTGHRRGTLADGSVTRLNVYLARIDWHGIRKRFWFWNRMARRCLVCRCWKEIECRWMWSMAEM